MDRPPRPDSGSGIPRPVPVASGADPRAADPVSAIEERGEVVVVGVVTVESRVPNITPVEYFLEWVLVSGIQEILLTSYRDNEDCCQFVQPDRQRVSYWNMTKTIWTDNPGTYVFRVYRKDEDGTLVLETQAELRV